MTNSGELLSLGVVIIIIILSVAVFIFAALKIRRKGGSFATNLFGATYEFYGKDKREAIEVITELKAGKKWEEEESGKPLE